MVAGDENTVAQESDVPIRVPRQFQHPPAFDLVALPQKLGTGREANQRPCLLVACPLALGQRLGHPVQHEPVANPLGPVVTSPHALALRVVERALRDGHADERSRADVVRVHVRDDDAPDPVAEATPGVPDPGQPQPRVDQHAAGQQVAVDVLRPQRQRQGQADDARCERMFYNVHDVVDVEYREEPCRSALNRVRGMPFGWSLNPYMGCVHQCTFCYVRAFERRADRPSDDRYGRSIRVKVNVAEVLRVELARPSWEGEGVVVGAATDPYQPVEGRYRLTRSLHRGLRRFLQPVLAHHPRTDDRS